MQTAVAAPACQKCQTTYINDEAACRVCGARRATSQSSSSFKPTLIGLTLLAAVIGIAAAFFVNLTIRRTEAFKNSLGIALASPTVRNMLGDQIRAQSPLGHFVPFGNSTFMEWSVPLRGSRGHGHLYGVANQINGAWDFSRLTFESDDHGERLELTPVRKSSLPPVPSKHVYLVPLGLVEGEYLGWAPDYYKSKFGIEVSILPSLSPQDDIIDRKRNQIIAENCIDSLRQKYPQLARDPSAILIALTSTDIYIRSFGWRYAENFRTGGRFALVSSARIHPPAVLQRANHEWLNSRLEKLLTKNIAILYFDLPLTNDYTSVLTSGMLSGLEIDEMGHEIIGGKGYWDPFVDAGTPSITIYDVPGKEPMWSREFTRWPLPDTTAQIFNVDLSLGLFVQRKVDFVFEDEPVLQFSRLYRTQDDRSRAFGIGGTHSFDMFIVGQMGVAIDLILDDGSRIHYMHHQPVPGQRGDIYAVTGKTDNRFFESQAIFLGDHWEIKTQDGWTYFFPYTPKALPQYVTVLTSFTDPAQRKYEMRRDSFGALLEVTSPSGKWLRFENDSAHRIQRITSSTGRSMQYDYEDGCLVRATDSEGRVDSYVYDDKGEMRIAGHGGSQSVLVNEYFNDGYIRKQVMADDRTFTYYSSREDNRIRETQVVDPNGLETYIQYVPGGFIQSLPQPPPPGRSAEQLGRPELIETPSEWRSHGIERVKVLNRDADSGEVEIDSRSDSPLRMKAEGVFLSCKDAAPRELCQRNLGLSSLATFVRIDSTRIALLLFSNDNRPDLGSFWIILLDNAGKPYPALHLPAFGLAGIHEDSNGVLIVGRKTLSEACCAADATTYDPYGVYLLAKKTGAVAKFSLKATEEYNRKNYVWAGPEYREDVLVQQRPGGKAKIIPNPIKPKYTAGVAPSSLVRQQKTRSQSAG